MTVSDHAPSRRQRTGQRAAETDGERAAGPITVSLVNDYEVVVHGLNAMLSPFADRVTVVELEVEGEPDRRADVALFDTFGGHRHAIERAGRMIADAVVDHVVLYTWDSSDDLVDDARRIGVHGIISKEACADEVVAMLERIVAGERIGVDAPWSARNSDRNGSDANGDDANGDLSEREAEVLALLALGLSNKQIATELYLSIETVRTYVRRLYAKLGVSNRAQAAVHATLHGVAPPTRTVAE